MIHRWYCINTMTSGVATHWAAWTAAPGPNQTCWGPQALMTNHMWGLAYLFLAPGPTRT